MEDHALEAVPEGSRKGWLSLSWSTVGIVTTLVQLFIGALTTFVAGLHIAVLAGITVAVIGALLGWGVGHVRIARACQAPCCLATMVLAARDRY